MYILGALCLVAAAVALPVLPDPPTLPDYVVKVEEYKLHTNSQKIAEGVDVKGKEDQKDENKENKEQKEDKVNVLKTVPSPPELPPMELIFENIKNSENVPKETEVVPKEAEEIVSEAENSEPKEEEAKEENEVEIKVEDNEKPAVVSRPTIFGWNIPMPPFLNNIVSSMPSFPISIPYFSNISWPFKLPSFFRQPRINYPGYVVLEQM